MLLLLIHLFCSICLGSSLQKYRSCLFHSAPSLSSVFLASSLFLFSRITFLALSVLLFSPALLFLIIFFGRFSLALSVLTLFFRFFSYWSSLPSFLFFFFFAFSLTSSHLSRFEVLLSLTMSSPSAEWSATYCVSVSNPFLTRSGIVCDRLTPDRSDSGTMSAPMAAAELPFWESDQSACNCAC